MTTYSRRGFLAGTSIIVLDGLLPKTKQIRGGLEKLATAEYRGIRYSDVRWQELFEGLYFSRIDFNL